MRRSIVNALAIAVLTAGTLHAQGRQAGPPSPRTAAPLDVTGTWIAVVTEDWRWRMRTPPKGDLTSLPLTDAAIKVANAWDPARDTAAGEQCRGYGAAGVLRLPGRIRFSWQNDTALRLETEAGTQTRLLQFGRRPAAPARPGWQGVSTADWQFAGGRRGGTAGSLRVVTTNLRPGYLRKNGVPYSADAQLTEFFNVVTDATSNDTWLVVTTMVEDPQYLRVPRFVTSSHFRKVDASAWNPTPCIAE